MKAVVQRVTSAQVTVGEELIGRIDSGLLILLGVAAGDTEHDGKALAEKIGNLRIFNDDAGKMNLSVRDIGGAVLVVSQFTLLADTQRGRRPSFVKAAPPDLARALYEQFAQEMQKLGIPSASGQFGAHMAISLVNDGPVTIILESQPGPGSAPQ